ncbi:MAG TPA: DUF1259 domain-containing protein [Fimbriimonas sp.]|nr:DUF1259 domain-containing protein [Fimbriimonas sp.]
MNQERDEHSLDIDFDQRQSRRSILRNASVGAATLLLPGLLAGSAESEGRLVGAAKQGGSLTPSQAKAIEDIIQAEGSFSNGVFSIELDREDISSVKLHGVPILPSFEINGTLSFERIGYDRVFLNGDMCLKSTEINSFIDVLIAQDIKFQAEHQHFYDFYPMVWFIHFRAEGEVEQVAHKVKAALDTTSTPFPQKMPKNPTTLLPADQLAHVLGGDAEIGSDGVVTVDVPRADRIRLGGRMINPFLGVQTTIAFEPYGGGQNAVVIPDFGMVYEEIQRVVEVMRDRKWDVGCLYNQETDEHPQLYFSHMAKVGDAVTLAHEVRKGLSEMNMSLHGQTDH